MVADARSTEPHIWRASCYCVGYSCKRCKSARARHAPGTARSARFGGRVTSHLLIACPERSALRRRRVCNKTASTDTGYYTVASQPWEQSCCILSSTDAGYSCGKHAVSSCLLAVLMRRAVTRSRFSIVLRHRSFLDQGIGQKASPAVMPHRHDADKDGMYLGRPSVMVAKRLERLDVGLKGG